MLNTVLALRQELKLTRIQLAVKAKVCPQTIYMIERLNHRPRLEVAKRIARALGVKHQELWPTKR